MTDLPAIAILGAGSMGGAILSGLRSPDVHVDGGIRVTNRTVAKADALAGDGVTSYALERDAEGSALALTGAKIVLIGVKPYMVADLLDDIRDHLEPDAIVVSLAAGVTAASMEERIPNVVVRSMPNTPSTVGLGVTGVAGGSRASDDDVALVARLFETVGSVVVVEEDQIAALSTISGSGPAFVFLFIEKYIEVARGLGFDAEQARTMVEGTFRGASELLAAAGDDVDAAELRRRVTSPKGTTEKAVEVLESGDLAGLFARASQAAIQRTQEIAEGR
ncbi:pyrroline-5-carboxylate reductase [Schumannella sp. 10F1B-5-1]|uniref:pyrroline-5-carboxylate reductase n=1 Tax=Schumannella sp. 10F1B-5-1 TaxID=2590780 RepID=UPI0021029C91|nr:pyrroline-5-carboxylate reductase [Schumannella sp. 10F1B-5-1]